MYKLPLLGISTILFYVSKRLFSIFKSPILKLGLGKTRTKWNSKFLLLRQVEPPFWAFYNELLAHVSDSLLSHQLHQTGRCDYLCRYIVNEVLLLLSLLPSLSHQTSCCLTYKGMKTCIITQQKSISHLNILIKTQDNLHKLFLCTSPLIYHSSYSSAEMTMVDSLISQSLRCLW